MSGKRGGRIFPNSMVVAVIPSKEVTAENDTAQVAENDVKKGLSETFMELEDTYGCHNYAPIPVVITSAQGCVVTDVEGKKYYDCLSAYSSLNQGHLHPRLVAAVVDQLQRVSITSRAFYTDKLGEAERFICETFGYDKCLLMNTGVEAIESALKLARRWGYDKKHIPENQAVIIAAKGNFHGRTISVISFSDDVSNYKGFGPFTPGFVTVPFGDLNSLSEAMSKYSDRLCAVLIEPIQGEGGVVVPPSNYVYEVAQLCKTHNAKLIVDEIQTGLGRTGDLLCHYRDDDHPSEDDALYKRTTVKPDIVTMGKALGGGVYPVSCVLADDDVMLCIKPGEHGSTYGGNPLACAVAITALQIIKDEKLPERAKTLGKLFQQHLTELQAKYPQVISLVRGRGLLWGVVINHEAFTAYDLCIALRDRGMLAKPTHQTTIRISPPLVITEEQLKECANIIEESIVSCLASH